MRPESKLIIEGKGFGWSLKGRIDVAANNMLFE
jgi:hypothetical protein